MDIVKINNQIQAKELRVIDEDGKNCGVLSLEDALKLAKEKDLDLIEISPNTAPPVAKIISFDKYRYQQAKKEKKQRQGQKATELKQMRISARAAENDLKTKAEKINEFLNEGHNVEINLVLRGREKQNKAWAEAKLRGFLTMIQAHKILSDIKLGQRGFSIQITA
ncbi:MAG: translation initiation factor IF-3 [Candidatus Harrisonbacteria bacterium RIFCSPLOWO2_01_FULL_40_28]|uniref:Translation initiation factor IF-3 n=2 Tax=Candidatus Harrisoniibacteriota TaxID=1817905 RepID=A0A1G1ZYV6_9BACT|nr:MAG: translation initiation factor IF-3 [Candidatus Harrisonbacteria bacterium RIFCSPLOWO2_01_FULL_40_28]OGY69681.1 MAG: translation initiation factor IF-3 [Candidatus Harrisonbacteria bacterium RIFOXYD1_FULL_40_9]